MATRRYKRSGQSKRKSRTMRKKRGGNVMASTFSRALLPAGLLGLQMTYPTKKSMSRKPKKSRGVGKKSKK